MSRSAAACAYRRVLLVATAIVASWAGVASAARIPGGADPTTDCFAEFEVLGTALHPPGEDVQVPCTDCDPTCDKDADSAIEPSSTSTCT